MKKFILLIGVFFCIYSTSSARKVKKERDQIRFGYGSILEKDAVYGPDGNLISVTIHCMGAGADRCKFTPEDVPTQSFSNAVEAASDYVDNQINNGYVSGSQIRTIQVLTNNGETLTFNILCTWSMVGGKFISEFEEINN